MHSFPFGGYFNDTSFPLVENCFEQSVPPKNFTASSGAAMPL
jgi:hypothetical protein